MRYLIQVDFKNIVQHKKRLNPIEIKDFCRFIFKTIFIYLFLNLESVKIVFLFFILGGKY